MKDFFEPISTFIVGTVLVAFDFHSFTDYINSTYIVVQSGVKFTDELLKWVEILVGLATLTHLGAIIYAKRFKKNKKEDEQGVPNDGA